MRYDVICSSSLLGLYQAEVEKVEVVNIWRCFYRTYIVRD